MVARGSVRGDYQDLSRAAGEEVGQGSPITSLRLKNLCVTEKKHTWLTEVRPDYFYLENQAENVEHLVVFK